LILYQLLHGSEVRVIRGNPIAVHEVEIMGAAARRQRHRFLKSGARFCDPAKFTEKPAEVAMDFSVLRSKRNRLYIMCDGGLWHAALTQYQAKIDVRTRSFSAAGIACKNFAIKGVGLDEPAGPKRGMRGA
jgi:hypothetical protein